MARKRIKITCSACKRETNHSIEKEVDGYHEEDDVEASGEYQIVRCDGCERLSFREVWTNSDHIDENGCYEELETLYPETNLLRPALEPKHFISVPIRLNGLYLEVLGAYNQRFSLLCAAGLRALVEGVCSEQKIIGGYLRKDGKRLKNKEGSDIYSKSLAGKIWGLQEKGVLTESTADVLHKHRYLGNDALHELAKPADESLRAGIEIIEHTLVSLYELERKGSVVHPR